MLDPLIEDGLTRPGGIACLEVVLHLPARYGLDDGAFAHDLLLEGLLVGGKAREVIALGAKALQEVVERRDDLQPLGGERLLAWSLEVVDR